MVAHNFGMCMTASEHTWHTSDACHELALGMLHYTHGVQVQWIGIDNEMHCFATGQLLVVF